MRHRPRVQSPRRPRSPGYTLVSACALLLSSAGCDVGGSVLVPLRDASVKDSFATDITGTDKKDVPAGDVIAPDAPEVGMDGGADVVVDAPIDAGADVAPDAPVEAGADVATDATMEADSEVSSDAVADGFVTCGVGEVDCSGTCRNLITDPNHCGACDRACAITETCAGGLCAPVSVSGCADGTREAFTSTSMFPDIAACAGGFSVPGVFPPPARVGGAACATTGNSSLSNVNGLGCSASDLCGVGWHLCRGGVVPLATGGLSCAATTFPVDEFYVAAVSGTGCEMCALAANTVTAGCTSSSCTASCRERNDLTNGLFGCGTGRASAGCELTVTAGNRCADAPLGLWSCPSDTGESTAVTKAEAAGGGVLCCRG